VPKECLSSFGDPLFASCPLVERPHGIAEVVGGEVLVTHGHPWVAVTQDGHDSPLWNTGHGHCTRHVVSEIVEPQVRDAEVANQAGKRARQDFRVSLRKDMSLGIEGTGKLVGRFAERLSDRYRPALPFFVWWNVTVPAFRLVMRRILRLLVEGSIFIPPYARRRMNQRGLDDVDVVQILKTGAVRRNSHSLVDGAWRLVIDGATPDHSRASCVVEINGTIVIVTAYPRRTRH
jgi:hypothetical protein